MNGPKLFTTATSLALAGALLISANSFARGEGEGNRQHHKQERMSLLERLDGNADGVLSLDEFSDRNAEKAIRHFNTMDEDGDAALTLEEFSNGRHHRRHRNLDDLDSNALTACVEESLGYELPGRPDPETAFVEADLSSDGLIDLDEFLAAGDLRAAQRFAEIDSDSDGQLTSDEIEAHQGLRKQQRKALRSCAGEQRDEETLLNQ